MKKIVFTLAALGIAAVASAQNCPPNDGTLKVNPTKVCFEDPGKTNPLSAPVTYDVGFFVPGAPVPTQTTSVSAALATPITGAPAGSYQILFSALASYPVGTAFEMKIRGVNPSGTGAWSVATDPFGRPGTPGVPTGARVAP